MNAKNFNDVMRQAPEERLKMPPAEGGPSAARAWRNAVNGQANDAGISITQEAAASWLKAANDARRPPTHTELREALERPVR